MLSQAERSRRYHVAHPERCQAYRDANKLKTNAREKRRYEANPRESNVRTKKWRTDNPEKYKALKKIWIANNPDRILNHRLKAKYNMTTAERDAMFASQDGRCAICARKKKLIVDHCHVTKKVRGGLCYACNTSLGQLGDTSNAVAAALRYLVKFENQVIEQSTSSATIFKPESNKQRRHAMTYDFYTSTDDFDEPGSAHVGVYKVSDDPDDVGGDTVAVFYIGSLGVDMAEDLAIDLVEKLSIVIAPAKGVAA